MENLTQLAGVQDKSEVHVACGNVRRKDGDFTVTIIHYLAAKSNSFCVVSPQRLHANQAILDKAEKKCT